MFYPVITFIFHHKRRFKELILHTFALHAVHSLMFRSERTSRMSSNLLQEYTTQQAYILDICSCFEEL